MIRGSIKNIYLFTCSFSDALEIFEFAAVELIRSLTGICRSVGYIFDACIGRRRFAINADGVRRFLGEDFC